MFFPSGGLQGAGFGGLALPRSSFQEFRDKVVASVAPIR